MEEHKAELAGPPVPTHEPGAISLTEIWQILTAQKKLILTITGIMVVVALLIAVLTTPTYRASALLAPALSEKEMSPVLGRLSGQLGGLAGLAGISLGETGGTVEALAILTSRAFTENFLVEENILPDLYEDMWNPESQAWYPRRQSSLGQIVTALRRWLAEISGDRGFQDPSTLPPGPSMEAAVKQFNEIRQVNEDPKTQLVTLSVEWKDPEKAAQWVDLLIKRLNETTRQEAIAQAEKSIRFLEQEVRRTSNADIQTALYSLIESQMKKAMLANVNEEYSFRVIDPAVVPERRSSPKRALIVILGLFAGLALGIFIALFRQNPESAMQ